MRTFRVQQTKLLVETWDSVEAKNVEEAKEVADKRVPDWFRMIECRVLCVEVNLEGVS